MTGSGGWSCAAWSAPTSFSESCLKASCWACGKAWARAVARHAEGKNDAQALLAWDSPARTRLIGLLPVTSAMRALTLPLPALVAWQAYAPLTVPLLDRDAVDQAAAALIDAASEAGACGLLLPSITMDGPAAQALQRNDTSAARFEISHAAAAWPNQPAYVWAAALLSARGR